jgi:multiple sugar transport system permease protein
MNAVDYAVPASRGSLSSRFAEIGAIVRRDHLLWVLCALGPVFALFAIIRVYPILETIRLSFYRYHPTQRNRPFVGLENYWRLLDDDAFRTALYNTVQFCVLAVIITLTLAFTVAVLLRSIEKASPIYELLLYIPVVTPWVPASVIWKWIFDPIHGILNYALSSIGLPRLAWLQDEHVIVYAIVLVSVWKMLGYFVVVYGVGLRNIPDEVLEAAELDGATPWQRLVHVVVPLMKPLILFTVIIATIIFFNVFAPVYVLTASAQGAPAYDFKVLVAEIYQNAFVFYRMGYAGAQSVVLLVFVLSLVFLQFFLFRDKRREGAA